MKTQNYSNHNRLNPVFYGILFFMIVIVFTLSVINLIQNLESEQILLSGIIVMFSIITTFTFFFIRFTGKKLQNRIIRTEENLRHYMLTGKPMDYRLRMAQIAALRFSPDSEFPDLCERAVKDHLSADDIKKRIGKWKGDYQQV